MTIKEESTTSPESTTEGKDTSFTLRDEKRGEGESPAVIPAAEINCFSMKDARSVRFLGPWSLQVEGCGDIESRCFGSVTR